MQYAKQQSGSFLVYEIGLVPPLKSSLTDRQATRSFLKMLRYSVGQLIYNWVQIRRVSTCNHWSSPLRSITASFSACASYFPRKVKSDCVARPQCLPLCARACVVEAVSNDVTRCYVSSACDRRRRRRHVKPYIHIGLEHFRAFPALR